MINARELSWEWWPTNIQTDTTYGDSLTYFVGIFGVASTGQYAPFWMQSNQNGDISANPFSGNLSAGILEVTDVKL